MVSKKAFPSVSVVIAFRDWGLERLDLCLKYVRESLENFEHEVIVSDYGSTEHKRIAEICDKRGASHLYTPAEVWSKPHALNVGFQNASSEVIISLDADMIVSPSTLPLVANTVFQTKPSAAVVPSRDLPEELDEAGVRNHDGEWDYLEANSRVRARWGVGGCFGFHRSMLDVLGGIDQRMEKYAAEDLDFTDRCRRMGARVVWLDQPEARMYHVWHESTFTKMESDPEIQQAVARNREIYYNDKTISRNQFAKRQDRASSNPLVSVIISTYNRGDLIEESIFSVLSQSVRDFELIIVDDGSTDNTEEVVKRIPDDRIRYFRKENSGISSARNFGFSQARGAYIAVHDDDDLMVPRRLEYSFSAMTPGVAITYGSHINFDDVSGAMTASVMRTEFGEKFLMAAAASPGHSTWLAKRSVYESLSYDEGLEAGVDHNFAVRTVLQGWKWAHTGQILLMRRQHSGQITGKRDNPQQNAAKQSMRWFRKKYSYSELAEARKNIGALKYPSVPGLDDLKRSYGAWLPDDLVKRDIECVTDAGLSSENIDGTLNLQAILKSNGSGKSFVWRVEGATWSDLAVIRKTASSLEVLSHRDAGLQSTHSDASVVESVPFVLRPEVIGNAKVLVMSSEELVDLDCKKICEVPENTKSARFVHVVEDLDIFESWQDTHSAETDLSIFEVGVE